MISEKYSQIVSLLYCFATVIFFSTHYRNDFPLISPIFSKFMYENLHGKKMTKQINLFIDICKKKKPRPRTI